MKRQHAEERERPISNQQSSSTPTALKAIIRAASAIFLKKIPHFLSKMPDNAGIPRDPVGPTSERAGHSTKWHGALRLGRIIKMRLKMTAPFSQVWCSPGEFYAEAAVIESRLAVYAEPR